MDVPATPKPQEKRVAAYCRVSTDLEEQQSSIEIQMASFRAQIDARPGWKLVDIYTDNGISGTQVEHRTEFLRMMDDCEKGNIDYIITKSISRFARNTLECLSYVRRLKEKGIYIYFEKERLDTSSDTSEMLLSILAAVAQEESRNISENIKWSQRKRFAEGRAKWSAVYGYKKDGELEYIVNEEQAAVVRRIFAEYARGKSLPEIIRAFEHEGIPSPWGRTWTPTVMANILKNEKYCGDVLIQKSYTVDHISHQRVWNDQTVVPSYYVRDHHTPIVDRKTFEMVQVIRSLKDRHKGATQYPYYGRLVCPICGGMMVRNCIQEHGHPPVWCCLSDSGYEMCQNYYVKEKYIDAAFKDAYADLDISKLQKQFKCQDDTISQAALVAIELKTSLPEVDKVEYYLLDALVEQITFPKWDGVLIEWKFGLKTKIRIEYEKNRDIPNHKEQLEFMKEKSKTRVGECEEKRCRHNSFERPCIYGYDSIVHDSDDRENRE